MIDVLKRIIPRRTQISLSHEVGDKINVDSYRRAVRHLPAGTGGVVWCLAGLGLDGDREEPRVPDPARDPSDPCSGVRRMGWREGGLQSPVAARALRVFPAPMYLFLNDSALIYGVGYSLLGFGAHSVGAVIHARSSRRM